MTSRSGFSFETTPRLIAGDDASLMLAEHCRALGMRRPMVLTDSGLVKAGILVPSLRGFADLGLKPTVFSDVQMDPPEQAVMAAVTAAEAAAIDGVVGFGGGSSMDSAKLVALLVGRPQALPDIYGIGLAKGPRLPLIQVPTTAGTGSEVTPIAIVTTPGDEKKGVVSPLLYPDLAILDGKLTWGLPPAITAMTGIDAMVHAIEAFTSRHKKNPMSDALAVKALQLLYGNIRRVIADGQDGEARAAMLQGAMLAGMAFANAPVAAVHALAYPIGGQFHVPHGLSNALVMLPVMTFNQPAADALYGALAAAILPGKSSGTALIDAVADLLSAMPLPQRLRDVGIADADLPGLASDALKVQRLLINNPRDVTYDDALALYRAAF